MRPRRILILGGTSEARRLAERLAPRSDLAVTLSLAGRTASPAEHAVPVRSGGFGGAEGLADYIMGERISLVVDATHPFARRISRNAIEAMQLTGIPLLVLRRPPWSETFGDDWVICDSAADAVAKLGAGPRRVFVALGRQDLAPLERAPQHSYLIRSVDAVDPPLQLPHARYVLARGPFVQEAERALLEEHRIDAIIAKNSGGDATYGKIAAARALGITVFMIEHPDAGEADAEDVESMVAQIDHRLGLGSARGV